MLLSTLPRVLSTQEEITVPVNVFAMEKEVKNVSVSIQASGGGVQVIDPNKQSITFSQPGDQLVYFKIKTGSKTGKATIHITANGGSQQAKETIEIEVRNPNAAAQNWRMPDQDDSWGYWQTGVQQAYRLYTLALAGAPEQGAMNRMKEQANLPLQAKWRLAAAYALTGKMKPAEELVFKAETTVTPYSSQNYIYGSYDRDEAMILETLLLMNRDQAALQQAKKVSKNLAEENWFSTQSTAFSLMAMGRLAEKLSGTLDFTWTWNGKQQPVVKSAKAVFAKELSTSPASGNIIVKNEGKGALSVDLITRTQLLNDTLPAISNNLRLDVKYTDMNGATISIDDIKQGTDFMAVITVGNISGTTAYSNLALTHILPSGWEIYNDRLMTPEATPTREYTYQDIRDDRVLTYFDLRRSELKKFTIRLQATYAGNFILPAIQCEAMYDGSAQARTKAGRTTVSK